MKTELEEAFDALGEEIRAYVTPFSERQRVLRMLDAIKDQYETPSVPQVSQPIESAPKDGTVVQVWYARRQRWEIATYIEKDLWEARDKNWCWTTDELTHWLPLPPPPGEVAPQVCPNCEEMRRVLSDIDGIATNAHVLDAEDGQLALSEISSAVFNALSTLKSKEPLGCPLERVRTEGSAS